MPKANWGISAGTVENFDRERQFTPYDGPIPGNGVYIWRIKKLQYVAATREKVTQLRVGLELQPRRGRKEERAYKGYFVMLFLPVADNTAFRYVPFLDAIGVSEDDFRRRTITDQEGGIKTIGRWRNTGEELIKGQLVDDVDQAGNPRKTINWIGSAEEVEPDDSDDADDDSEDGDDYFDEEEEEYGDDKYGDDDDWDDE